MYRNMRTQRVTVEPFNRPLYIARSEQAWDMLELDPEDCVGAVLVHKGKMYVALPETYNEEVVWHEAHHVARMLNREHGIITDGNDHEIDAYLQEHVVRLIKTVYKVQ